MGFFFVGSVFVFVQCMKLKTMKLDILKDYVVHAPCSIPSVLWYFIKISFKTMCLVIILYKGSLHSFHLVAHSWRGEVFPTLFFPMQLFVLQCTDKHKVKVNNNKANEGFVYSAFWIQDNQDGISLFCILIYLIVYTVH